MLLTIDIGNTNMVLGVFDGDTIVEHWRIATVPDRTADEIAALLYGLLARSTAPRAAAIASSNFGNGTVVTRAKRISLRGPMPVGFGLLQPVHERQASGRSAPGLSACATAFGGPP